MYCEKCRKTFNNNFKFCDNCGEKLIEKKVIKKKKTGLIIGLIILALSLIIASTLFAITSLFKYTNRLSTLEYVTLDKDKVPTIYNVNKEIGIDFYSKEIDGKEIEIELEYYYDLNYYDNIIDEYSKLLEENGFTRIYSGDDIDFVKQSTDNDFVVKIEIDEEYDYDGNYFIIKYEKERSNINKYIKEITYKRVGEEKYGYIDIDSTWNIYIDINNKDMIQYKGQDGFLTLYYIDNPNFNTREYMSSIYSYLINDGLINLNVDEVKVSGYNAYQISGYYEPDKMYVVIWCFLDENNIMHYIEINSLNYNSEVFSKIESYSITK